MSIQKAYDIWSQQYDTNENKTRDLDKKNTAEVLSNYKFSNVIELGCGTGKNTEFLLTKAQRVNGINFSEKMLAKASSKFKNENVVFQRSDLTTNWDLPESSADLITCNLVLEHIEDLSVIFRQAFQKLKKGGLFFISDLHPFKQYAESKARFETENGTQLLETYVHHLSDFLNAAKDSKLKLERLDEWFNEVNSSELPRLISFVFYK